MHAWFLNHSKKCVFYESTFAALFIFGRVFVGTWYVLNVWGSELSVFFKLTSSAIYSVSLFWVFVIMMKVMKKLKGTKYRMMDYIFGGMDWLRKHKVFLIFGILVAAVGMPVFLSQILDLKFVNLKINGFSVI